PEPDPRLRGTGLHPRQPMVAAGAAAARRHPAAGDDPARGGGPAGRTGRRVRPLSRAGAALDLSAAPHPAPWGAAVGRHPALHRLARGEDLRQVILRALDALQVRVAQAAVVADVDRAIAV